jgi:hypothetical protein
MMFNEESVMANKASEMYWTLSQGPGPFNTSLLPDKNDRTRKDNGYGVSEF